MKDNKKIKERAYEFAIDIIQVAKKMPKDPAGFVLGRQLIKSGTSIGQMLKKQRALSVKMILFSK